MNHAIYAGVIALGSTLVAGPALIQYLRGLKCGQVIRTDGPERHLTKAGTPSMGGVLILLSAFIGSLSTFPTMGYLPWALFVMASYGLVGLTDDYISIVSHRSLGLRARHKLIFQAAVAFIVAGFAYADPGLGSVVAVPFFPLLSLDLGLYYIPFAVLLLMGFSNAVNLSDGLDGLAAGLTAIACLAYTVVAVGSGRPEIAGFAAAVGGACVGFTWWNAHPAQVFMGDTGSLALGGALGAIAILTKTELLLPIIGGVFVAETLSVTIQVISFRLTKRRVFRMSPLHHHFELAGLSETHIVVRFWIVAAVFAVLGFVAWWPMR